MVHFRFQLIVGNNLDCMTNLTWTNEKGFHLEIHGWKGADKLLNYDYRGFLDEVKEFLGNGLIMKK